MTAQRPERTYALRRELRLACAPQPQQLRHHHTARDSQDQPQDQLERTGSSCKCEEQTEEHEDTGEDAAHDWIHAVSMSRFAPVDPLIGRPASGMAVNVVCRPPRLQSAHAFVVPLAAAATARRPERRSGRGDS